MGTPTYPLTDFTLKELQWLSFCIASQLDHNIQLAQDVCDRFPEGDIKTSLMVSYREGLPELREMHVRVLTAIGIVKQRETTHAN